MNDTHEYLWTTPDLCDAHPDQVRVAAPLFRSYGRRSVFCGSIVTVRCFEDNSRVKEQVGLPGRGKVLVVDGGGSLRRALLGDLLAEQAAANRWEGIVIHGCVRDVPLLAGMDLGVLALASVPLKTERRGVGELDVPLDFAGIDWRPGDWLYADATGVIVAPARLG